MSDTPRTDAVGAQRSQGDHNDYLAMSEHARTLERENAELAEALRKLVELDDGDKPDLWYYQNEFDEGRRVLAKRGKVKP